MARKLGGFAPLIGARDKLSCQAALPERDHSLGDREVLKAAGRLGASAAYQLNEADLAPCGRDSASLRPLVSAGTEKPCPCRESGGSLSRAPLGGQRATVAMRKRKIIIVVIALATIPFAALVLAGYRGVWIPETCASVLGPESIKGHRMAFTLPSGVAARASNDVDYQMRVICYKRRCMRFGWGPTWSGVTLPAEMLADLQGIRKRVVLARNFFPIGTEYRGSRADGTRFRFVTTFGESIDYDRSDNESAAAFDKTIDSLCWAKQ